ncbi:MAG: cycloartenol synthase, partial [Verrucomicrobiales bacterium]|nr:cycloartenol synthase [Verrucomicrobiales bacterium]
KDLITDGGTPQQDDFDLDWDAAISFVSRCQNLTATNDQPWASDDPDNKGGFIYFPGDSKSGEQQLAGDQVALRSYGSMSYAGLLSLIYAKLDPSDQRIVAVLDWLKKNYTLEENPGLNGQGLFYYYHSMAKALRILNIDQLTLADGTRVDWRKDLSTKLMDLQQPDGSWVNPTGRWWENDPVLVTSYAVLTLEHIHRSL